MKQPVLAITLAFGLGLGFGAQAQETEYALGLQYHSGEGVVQNYAAAARYFEQAASLGFAPAQNFLGRYLFEGLGVPQDKVAALQYLEQAAAGGDPQYIFDLAKILELDDASVMRAAQLYETATDLGHLEAAVHLGALFQEGRGVDQDLIKARTLYEGPARQGNPRALNNLGLLYVRGTGVPQDYEKAVEFFQAAADQGLKTAMTNLGVMYENGYGVPIDEAQAAALYRAGGRGTEAVGVAPFVYDTRLKPVAQTTDALDLVRRAADAGDPVAQFQLGWVLVQNADTSFDTFKRAARLFESGAKAGHGPSMINLAGMYLRAEGLPQDYVLAQMWILLARSHGADVPANLGDALAQKMTPEQVNMAQSLASAFFNQD